MILYYYCLPPPGGIRADIDHLDFMRHSLIITVIIAAFAGLVIPCLPASAQSSPATSWSLTAVGDIMLDRNVWNKIKQYGKTYPFAKITTELKGADMALGNLEGPFTSSTKHAVSGGALLFNFDPIMAPVLKQSGFTILSLANNHTLNQGQAGLDATRQILKKLGLIAFGDPRNATGFTKTQTINDQKITFIGYHGLANGFESVVSEVKKARKTSDVVVVVPHWGAEYKLNIQPRLKVQAHQLVDAGADMVLGGHPHVVEPMEVYKNRFIAYSLGNFIFDQYFSSDTQQGLMLKITAEDKKLTIKIIPLVSVASQIQLAPAATRKTLLNRVAAGTPNSESIRRQIRSGTLIVTLK